MQQPSAQASAPLGLLELPGPVLHTLLHHHLGPEEASNLLQTCKAGFQLVLAEFPQPLQLVLGDPAWDFPTAKPKKQQQQHDALTGRVTCISRLLAARRTLHVQLLYDTPSTAAVCFLLGYRITGLEVLTDSWQPQQHVPWWCLPQLQQLRVRATSEAQAQALGSAVRLGFMPTLRALHWLTAPMAERIIDTIVDSLGSQVQELRVSNDVGMARRAADFSQLTHLQLGLHCRYPGHAALRALVQHPTLQCVELSFSLGSHFNDLWVEQREGSGEGDCSGLPCTWQQLCIQQAPTSLLARLPLGRIPSVTISVGIFHVCASAMQDGAAADAEVGAAARQLQQVQQLQFLPWGRTSAFSVGFSTPVADPSGLLLLVLEHLSSDATSLILIADTDLGAPGMLAVWAGLPPTIQHLALDCDDLSVLEQPAHAEATTTRWWLGDTAWMARLQHVSHLWLCPPAGAWRGAHAPGVVLEVVRRLPPNVGHLHLLSASMAMADAGLDMCVDSTVVRLAPNHPSNQSAPCAITLHSLHGDDGVDEVVEHVVSDLGLGLELCLR